MTAAQKKARENFKKAIAYRTKTGCSLKQAFAHVRGNKVATVKKKFKSLTPEKKVDGEKKLKYGKNKVGKVKKAPIKKAAKKTIKKSAIIKKKTLHYAGRVKSKDGIRTYKYVLGSIRKGDHELIKQFNTYKGLIRYYENNIDIFKDAIKKHKERGLTPANIVSLKKEIKKSTELIKECKTHLIQLKKHI
jgi:hypothetical protein